MIAADRNAEALLRAIIDQPDDDLPRLAYADWLEDNGECEGAEFIRVQIRAWEDWPGGDWNDLCARANVLLTRSRFQEWFGAPPGFLVNVRSAVKVELYDEAAERTIQLGLRRGFVERIECSLAVFLEHAGAVFAAHPVQEVRLTDREPLQLSTDRTPNDDPWKGWCVWTPAGARWRSGEPGLEVGRDELPQRLFDLLGGKRLESNKWTVYESSRDDAIADLSTAARFWGRQEAEKILASLLP
jgi:uncharacterized protein (TIGR02996 family)